MSYTRRQLVLATAGTGIIATVFPASAQQPSSLSKKPTTLTVPYTAGGSADVIARLVAKAMSDKTKQPIVIDNKTGAGGTIGATAVARAEPDGHSLLLVTDGMYSINPMLFGKTAQDALLQLTPVAALAEAPLVIAVVTSSPLRNVKDLIQAVRSKKGNFTYGTPGIGSAHHLFGELLGQKIGTPLNHVPYKGAAAAMGDLAGGQLDCLVTLEVSIQPLVEGGKARIIAITSRDSDPSLPGIEPVSRSLDGIEMSGTYGLMTRTGTPPDLIAQWNRLALDALHDATVTSRMKDLGLRPVGGSADAFGARIVRERQLREQIITAANIKLAS